MDKQERLKARIERRKLIPKAIITPIPISNCVSGDDIKDDILKYMFCSSGTINKVLIDFVNKPKDGVTIGIDVVSDLGSNYRSYVTTRKNMLVNPDIEVNSGNKLIISIAPIDDTKITEVWVAILWTPKMKDTELQKILIEDSDA